MFLEIQQRKNIVIEHICGHKKNHILYSSSYDNQIDRLSKLLYSDCFDKKLRDEKRRNIEFESFMNE
jgi:hypothetical protein